MFTVKHIRIGGDEDILEASTVRFSPGFGEVDAVSGSNVPSTVWISIRDGGDERPLTGGTVFVMNEAGKTVSRYDIGASQVPITLGRMTAEKQTPMTTALGR